MEKIGLFFLQIQGELAAELAELRKKQTIFANEIMHSQQSETALLISSLAVSSAEEGNSPLGRELKAFYGHYHALAVLLLHLIHFVDSNVTGIRKILKKHDKITKNHLTSEFVSKPITNSRELKHLWSDMLLRHYEGITALNMTLKIALTELKNLEYHQHYHQFHQESGGGSPLHHRPNNQKPPRPEKSRHQPTISMPNIILTLEDLAQAAAVSSAISTAAPKSMTPQALSSKRPYGSTEPVDANRNNMTKKVTSSYELDAILLKVEAARRRLNISSNTFQDLLAAQIIMLEPTGSEDLEEMDEDVSDEVDEKWLSHLLNLTSTFLYMTNYYVVAPTSGHYAKMLGGDEALAGIIIGMTPIAALVSTILYSWWTSHSYKVSNEY